MNETSPSSSVGSVAQANLAAVAPGRELKARERVHGHHIGLDTPHVAESELGATRRQQAADTLAEPGQVGTRDRAAHGKSYRGRPGARHWDRDGRAGRKSSGEVVDICIDTYICL